MAEGRDRVTVSGPDAATFLQGQLSQDVEGLAVGATAPSLLLQPDGKLGFVLDVERTEPTVFVLLVDAPFGDDVTARLQRFKLRVDCEIELDAGDRAGLDPDAERQRIQAGRPRMGAEIVDGVIPEEAGVVAGAVDFTKGCYVGQELVARIDSRGGNVPRRLRRLVGDGGEVPPVGATITVDGESVGQITSSAGAGEGFVALGYVKRSVVPPAAAVVDLGASAVEATVEAVEPA